MDYFSPQMPLQAYFIEDDQTLNQRIPFRCRIVEEGGPYYQRNIGGLTESGYTAVILTKTNLPYKNGSKVILDDITYSVVSVRPFIPDTTAQGIFRRQPYKMFEVQLNS